LHPYKPHQFPFFYVKAALVFICRCGDCCCKCLPLLFSPQVFCVQCAFFNAIGLLPSTIQLVIFKTQGIVMRRQLFDRCF